MIEWRGAKDPLHERTINKSQTANVQPLTKPIMSRCFVILVVAAGAAAAVSAFVFAAIKAN